MVILRLTYQGNSDIFGLMQSGPAPSISQDESLAMSVLQFKSQLTKGFHYGESGFDHWSNSGQIEGLRFGCYRIEEC